jgi:hypothetical protein
MILNMSNTKDGTSGAGTIYPAVSWGPVLVVEEVGVPGENHRPWASNW